MLIEGASLGVVLSAQFDAGHVAQTHDAGGGRGRPGRSACGCAGAAHAGGRVGQHEVCQAGRGSDGSRRAAAALGPAGRRGAAAALAPPVVAARARAAPAAGRSRCRRRRRGSRPAGTGGAAAGGRQRSGWTGVAKLADGTVARRGCRSSIPCCSRRLATSYSRVGAADRRRAESGARSCPMRTRMRRAVTLACGGCWPGAVLMMMSPNCSGVVEPAQRVDRQLRRIACGRPAAARPGRRVRPGSGSERRWPRRWPSC